MPYLIGVAVAVLVVVFGALSGFQRERAFYPLIVIVTASYYVLFAALSGDLRVVAAEFGFMLPFVALGVLGLRRGIGFAAAGLAAHGLLDLVHGHLLVNAGLPVTWPAFCLAFDVVGAGYVAWLVRRHPSLAAAAPAT